MTLSLGSNLDETDIKENDDVYFECHIKANPKAHKVTWLRNVSVPGSEFSCASRLIIRSGKNSLRSGKKVFIVQANLRLDPGRDFKEANFNGVRRVMYLFCKVFRFQKGPSQQNTGEKE